MKKLAVLFALLIVTSLQAKIVEESFYIQTDDQKTFEMLKSRPELTIDHIEKGGFELYGPKGLGEFLDNNNDPHFVQDYPSNK